MRCRQPSRLAASCLGWVFWVVSGLARGVDSAAHRGALSGSGKTVAVMGCGLDRIYPPENRRLAEEILERGGLLVSEYPPGIPPSKRNFPERNRIISGLCLGTLVVEAAEKSGSLLTADFALEQGREVFALPARFDETCFRGCHRLIQNGAKLVTSLADIVEELGFEVTTAKEIPQNKVERLLARSTGASLSELNEVFQNLGVAIPVLLQEGIKAGRVVEISPQYYVWSGVILLGTTRDKKNIS